MRVDAVGPCNRRSSVLAPEKSLITVDGPGYRRFDIDFAHALSSCAGATNPFVHQTFVDA